MFSKQHYELLARSFRQELDRTWPGIDPSSPRVGIDETGRGWLELMARNLAVDLQNDNHRFSTSRFLAACGVREYTATDQCISPIDGQYFDRRAGRA